MDETKYIKLTEGEILVSENVVIQGPGADKVSIRTDKKTSRIFRISNSPSSLVELEIRNICIKEGYAWNKDENGGAILVTNTGSLNALEVYFEKSKASSGKGGAIYIAGKANLMNCTFEKNESKSDGGGIYIEKDGIVKIVNCTFAGNHTTKHGGAIAVGSGGTLEIFNSTIVDNSSEEDIGGLNIAGTVTIANSIVAGNGKNDITKEGLGIISVLSNYNLIGHLDGMVLSALGLNSTSAISLDLKDYLDFKMSDKDSPIGIPFMEVRDQLGSPIIDKGNSALLPSDDFDIDGDNDYLEPLPLDVSRNTRIQNLLDLGAMELTSSIPIVRISTEAINGTSISPGDGDRLIYKFKVFTSYKSQLIANQFSFVIKGDYLSEDFSDHGFKLWVNSDSDNLKEAMMVATTNAEDGVVSWSLEAELKSGNHHYYVTADIDDDASYTSNFYIDKPDIKDFVFSHNDNIYSEMLTAGDLFDIDNPLQVDRAALIKFYTETNGSNWKNKAGWNTSLPLDEWYGVKITNSRVTHLELPDNNLIGNVPDDLVTLSAIQVIDLSKNDLSSFPDMSTIKTITSLKLDENRLSFKDLLPNKNLVGFTYLSQKRYGTTIFDTLRVGTDVVLSTPKLPIGTKYQWKFGKLEPGQTFNDDVKNIEGATTATYAVAKIGANNQGTYRQSATHPDLPGLTMESRNMNIVAHTDFTGVVQMKKNGAFIAVDDAEIVLYRQTLKGSFSKEDSTTVSSSGNYTFKDVTLGNFVLVAKPNRSRAEYARAIQTYYTSHETYQKADTLFLTGATSEVNIELLTIEPSPIATDGATIRGEIFREASDPVNEETSRTLARRKVRKAACSMRKFKSTGRTLGLLPELEENISYYIETNDEGYFNFEGVEDGRYLLGIEFPGVPLDPNAQVEFIIGEGKRNQVIEVDVLIKETGIEVTQNEISSSSVLSGNQFQLEDIELFPNPTSDYLHFQYNITKKYINLNLRVTNAHGVVILNQLLEHQEGLNSETVNLGNYPSGTYYLTVTDNSGLYSQVVKVIRK